jgi:hypothetical protein
VFAAPHESGSGLTARLSAGHTQGATTGSRLSRTAGALEFLVGAHILRCVKPCVVPMDSMSSCTSATHFDPFFAASSAAFSATRAPAATSRKPTACPLIGVRPHAVDRVTRLSRSSSASTFAVTPCARNQSQGSTRDRRRAGIGVVLQFPARAVDSKDKDAKGDRRGASVRHRVH